MNECNRRTRITKLQNEKKISNKNPKSRRTQKN